MIPTFNMHYDGSRPSSTPNSRSNSSGRDFEGVELGTDLAGDHVNDPENVIRKEDDRQEFLLTKDRSVSDRDSPQKESGTKSTALLEKETAVGSGADKKEVSSEHEVHKVPFFMLFKFANFFDYVLMVLGVLGAVGDGVSFPVMLYVLSKLINVFGNANHQLGPDEFMREVSINALRFTYVAIFSFGVCFLEAACWLRTGDRQASRMRSKYLRAILRQDVGFFDTAGANVAEVVNSVGADTMVIQDCIGEKVGSFIMNISGFFGGFIVAFLLSWRLALVIVAFLPVLMIPGFLYARALTGLARKMHDAYLKSATVAEQALSSIRTVYSFVGEQRTLTAYSAAMDATVNVGLKMGLAKGLATGAIGITFVVWAVMAWYGSLLIMHQGAGGGSILATGLGALLGGLALGTALPNLKYFAEAQTAAYRIFVMIERVPDIDSDDLSGTVLEKVAGNLELRNVEFSYPSRPQQPIFQNFNLTIPAGKTLALVGSSGSGKSTVIALLERYYDPAAGSVLIDGVNIKDIQLRWLRMQIGLVSQEPSMFATSIKENIMFGKAGALMDEVIAASKAANAHTFISALPLGYETQVGEKGVQMSGGQKQRIAIARALLKNPPILLLDEATSALDSESERVVQVALDKAAVGRTTVVVAHRLSTIRHADVIAVVHNGNVIQLGSHDELLRDESGAYSGLVNLQKSRPQNDLSQEVSQSDSSTQLREVSSGGRRSLSFRKSTSYQSDRSSPERLGQLEKVPESARKPPSMRRLLALNKPEWKQAIFAILGACGFGLTQPLFAFTLASMVSTFYEPDHNKMRTQIQHFALGFTALGIACFISNLARDYFFASMGERLTKRVRERLLANILTFEVGWFDEDQHSSSAICSKLASESTVVRSLVGDRISLMVQTLAAIILACVIGLVVAWPLAIVMIATQPIIIVCYYMKKGFLKTMNVATLKAQEESSKVASEAVANHRTITAFSSQDKMLALFESQQRGPSKEARRRALVAGLGLGTAQFCMFSTWAFDFWYGGRLINQGKITFANMFKAFFILVSTGRLIAEAGNATSDLAKGAKTVTSVFGILDRITLIKADYGEVEKLDKVEGHVEVQNVDFSYPMRPDILVFKGFTLEVKAGRSMALVGQSGSGKSTIIGLIERFYDPLLGKVKIDGWDIKVLHLQTLRRHIALVGQEPTLFAGTIRENILYGREDATEAEMIEAANSANAHTFISGLSSGYDTHTGERGLQLSGGQKQRIAIARAILKNPAILLLDEATSALDAQSEKIVQDALDRIMVRRTTIVVAHRLSTIQNADSIAVLQGGSILEQGQHHELLAKGEGGAYYELVKLQSRDH